RRRVGERRDDRNRDHEAGLDRPAEDCLRQARPHVLARRVRREPRLLRPARGAECAQLLAELAGLVAENLDRLDRPQRRVEPGDVAVEGVERLADALRLVAALGVREVLDARERRPALLLVLGGRPRILHPSQVWRSPYTPFAM